MARTYPPTLERFQTLVYREAETGCWLWTGRISPVGYGLFVLGKDMGGTKQTGAHRAAWLLFRGPIRDGMHLDHLCRVRRCVNALEHLELVTQAENSRRGNGISARNARATHCRRGHPYTEENTHIEKHGYRRCRRCAVITQQYHALRLAGQADAPDALLAMTRVPELEVENARLRAENARLRAALGLASVNLAQ